MTSSGLLRINVGCGTCPTKGYLNFDNSLTVRAAGVPGIPAILRRIGVLGEHQLKFASVAAESGIRWANASSHIPLPDSSVAIAYSSHMIEHLTRKDADGFLEEMHRVLVPGGILRLAVPDLGLLVRNYQAQGDADAFVSATLLAEETGVTLRDVIRRLIIGGRSHAWMYDGKSLKKLLEKHGFTDVVELPAGKTTIPDPGELDLAERVEESVYLEAKKPGA